MKKIKLLFIIFFISTSVFAQVSESTHHMEINGGSSDAGPVNGAPSVSVPIWEVTCGNLSLPIYLQYAVNGLGLNETPGRAGLSWRLNAGGTISQAVRSLNDFTVPVNFSVINSSSTTNAFCEQVVNGNENSEPDLFYFNAGNLSGTFFIDSVGNIHTEHNGYTKIEYTERTTTEGIFDGWFKITDAGGTVYTFEKATSQLNYDENGLKDEKSYEWYLTQIKSHDAVYNINLYYSRSDTLCYGKTVSYIEPKTFLQIWLTKKIEPLKPIVLLDSITTSTNEQTVEFNYAQSTYEYTNHFLINIIEKTYFDQFIQFVTVKDRTKTTINKAEFTYLQDYNNKRTFLNKLTLKGQNNSFAGLYSFDYYNLNELPSIYSTSFDFWGYYNGNTNTDLKDYANRFPDTSKVYYGMLKDIYYPGGGHKKFIYEANTYNFPTDINDEWYEQKWKDILNANNNQLIGPGVRVKRIENYEAIGVPAKLTDFSYNTSQGISSGKLSYYPYLDYTVMIYPGTPAIQTIYSVDPLNLEQASVNYKKVTIYQGGETTYNGDAVGVNGCTELYYYEPDRIGFIDNINYSLLSSGILNNLTEKQVVKDNRGKILSENISYFPDNKFTSIFSQGKRIRLSFDDADSVDYVEYFITPFRMYQKSIQVDSVCQLTTSSINTDVSETQKAISYMRINPLKSELENYKMPVEMTHTDSKGDTLKTVLYYPKDFAGDNGVFDKMIERNIVSPVIKNEVFKNSTRLSGTKSVFRFHITATSDTLIVPDHSEILEDGTYKTVQWFDLYNDKGQLLESHGIDGIHSCIIYGYNNTVPVATLANATYTQINAELSQNDVDIINEPSSDKELRNVISALRLDLPDAYISSSTYQPLVGKTSETDANDVSVYYSYDDLGRLSKAFNQDSILVKAYEYNNMQTSYTFPLIPVSALYLSPGSIQTDTFYCHNAEIDVQWNSEVYLTGDYVNIDYQTVYPTATTIRLAEHIPTEDGIYSFIPEQHDSLSSYDILSGKFIVSSYETPTEADTSNYNVQIKTCAWLTYPPTDAFIQRAYTDTLTIQWESLYNSGYDNYNIDFIPSDTSILPINIAGNLNKTLGEYLWTFNLLTWKRKYSYVEGRIRISASSNSAVFNESAIMVIGSDVNPY